MNLTLKISATIVLLLLISVYGYLQFREVRSYDQQVAKNANLVYKLNVDGLLKTIAADFIGNPGYYLKTNEKGKRRPDFSFPANIFVYSIKTVGPGTFFSGLTLADTTGLKPYLKRVLKIQDFVGTETGKHIGTSTDGKVTVLYNGKALAIAYSFKKEAVIAELNDILDQKNRMEDAAPLMIALKKAKGHLSWTTVGHTGQINFKDGRVEFEGNFSTEGLEIPNQPHSSVKFSDNALVKLWINAGFKASLMPHVSEMYNELSLKGISLQLDSLSKSYRGFAALEVGPGIKQIDSLIAYEYNDDFEKVATVQLKEVSVPHLKLSIGSRTGDLLAYLREKQVLSTDDRLSKKVFPLYQVFSSQKDNIWQLSTLENDPIYTVATPKRSTSNVATQNTSIADSIVPNSDFFSGTVDLKGIKAQQLFLLLNSWLKPFSHLKITAAKVDNGTARLNGRLEFENKSINAFTQMIR